MPSIVVRQKGREPEVVPLARPRITIGRSARADIFLRDPFASRLHAVLQQDGPYVLLADIGSANRTLLNGIVVREPRRLAPGDVIHIGETELTFLARDDAPLPPPVTLVGDARMQTSLDAVRDSDPETGQWDEPRDLHAIVSQVGMVLVQKSAVSDVLRTALELVFQALPAERGFVFLRQGQEIVCKVAATPTALLPRDPPPRLSRTILSRALFDGTKVLTADASVDRRFERSGSVEIHDIRSVIAVPLCVGSEIVGAIYVDNDIRNRFAEADLSVLETIAAVAAVKIEHERMLTELQEKRRIEEELKLASEIQSRLLPMTPPEVPGFRLSGISLPCREVGGDYFDFVTLPPRAPGGGARLGVAVGDVSGKGTGAALLISSVHAGLRAVAQGGDSVASTMGKLNRYLCEHAPSDRFVTLFYGELDADSGRLCYSNAGHEPPFVVRAAGTVERLREGGLAVGIQDDERYEEGETTLARGDLLVCYSDGISDAVNPRGERFGEDRILAVACAARTLPASLVRDRIEEALSHFVGEAASVDDMTLLVATRL